MTKYLMTKEVRISLGQREARVVELFGRLVQHSEFVIPFVMGYFVIRHCS